MPISAKESLKKLKVEVISCKKCSDLFKTRKQSVPGIGVSNARIIIVGDYPTEEGAEKAGIPYANDSTGKLIRKILDKTNVSIKKDTYITYLVKCTPRKIITTDENSKAIPIEPKPRHIHNCISFLSREISIITPHIIISLGLNTSNIILKNFFSIDKIYQDMEKIHMRVFANPSFKLVPFRRPQDVTITKTFSEEKYIKDFENLSKLFKVI